MTTEEIEKAANEFAEKHGFRVPYDGSNEFYDKVDVRASKDGFKAGAEFADKHWQEKTRWIPIEERLPAFEGKRRTVLVKTGDDLYSFLWIIQEVSLSDFECQDYTHWKEIE